MKTRIIETISNNIYILKFVKKASPFFIILSILVTLTAFIDTVSNTQDTWGRFFCVDKRPHLC